jgi:hypothetical protein
VPFLPHVPARERKHGGVCAHWRNERQHVGMASRRTLTADERSEVRAMETMIGIGVLLAGIGVFWVCFALGVYYFTRTGREGMRLQQMEAELFRLGFRPAVLRCGVRRRHGGRLFGRRSLPRPAGLMLDLPATGAHGLAQLAGDRVNATRAVRYGFDYGAACRSGA